MLDPSTPAKAHEEMAAPGPFGLRDFLNNLFFYRRAATWIALSVIAAGTLLALLLPPSYMARARLLTLNAGVYDMQPGVANPVPQQDPAAAVNTEMQLLASPELHRGIARTELGPQATPDAVNRRVRQLESHLHIAKVESANVIEIDYSDRDPGQAAAVLRQLLAGYFKARADVLTSGRVSFLTEQRDAIRGQLDEANAEIAAFEKQNGVVDVAAQVNGAVELDDRLHQDQHEAEAAVADSQKSVMVLLSNAQEVPKQVELYTDNSEAAHTMGTMQASLLQLEARRADLASRYMAGSPFVKQVDAQIAELTAAIAAQKTDLMTAHRTGYNQYHDQAQDRLIQAEANMAGATARRSVLNGQIAASGEHLKSLIAVSDTVARLRMQRDLLADTVKGYSTQLEQARIEQNQATTAGSTNVRVIESPVAPTRRSNPPLLMFAAGLVSALAIAGVTLIVLSSMRETFLSPQEAERGLRLPVLCDLPRRAAVRRDFGRVIAAINGAASKAAVPQGAGITGATSNGRGSGGKVVLLLTPRSEGDLRQTAEALAGALERRAPRRVALLSLQEDSAPRPEDSADALLSKNGIASGTIDLGVSRERLATVLEEVRSSYDYVLLTAPPASFSFESIEISTVADVVLLVVQAEETRRPVAEAIIAQVAHVGARVAGLVLTGRRYHIPAWIYSVALGKRSMAA